MELQLHPILCPECFYQGLRGNISRGLIMINNCMVILKPPEEPCLEPAMSLSNKARRLRSQSVSQFKHPYI
ncbi:MAG: hypothetical protein HZA00_13525 [Nitrospinae bacterium]|nr:hypothetical protein [Nitrospinota bacterium]